MLVKFEEKLKVRKKKKAYPPLKVKGSVPWVGCIISIVLFGEPMSILCD
jgi:hypothetical protein